MQIPVFMILMTAPVYVPRDLIQGWIETVAAVQPGDRDRRGRPQPDGRQPVPRRCSRSPPPRAWPPLMAVFARRGLRKAEAAG